MINIKVIGLSLLRVRRDVLVVVLLLALGMAFVVWIRTRQEAKPENPAEYGGFDEELVKLLKSESLEKSLIRLGTHGLPYVKPGVKTNDAILLALPLGPEADREQNRHVLQVLSNRRFVKVLQELSSMSREQASVIVSRELERALAGYQPLYEQCLPLVRRGSPTENMPGLALPWDFDNVDAPPTICGERYRIFCLLLFAANLELTGSQPAVLKVARKAHNDYVMLCNKDEFNEIKACCFVHSGSLYNRQVLASALLGTCKNNAVEAAAKRHGIKWETMDLAPFDALATPFDIRAWGGREIDYSKGKIPVRYAAPLSDEAFKDLLAAASP